MASPSTYGKRLIGLAGVLGIVSFTGVTEGPDAPLSAVEPLVGLWWLLAAVGVGLLVVARYQGASGGALPGTRPSLGHDRQDIIAATDWSRMGKHALRRSYGVALMLSAAVVMVLALALQEFFLAGVLVATALLGAIVAVLTWRGAYEIFDDHTEQFTIRAPDNFAAHSFHIALRQRAEDLGYVVSTNVSPTQGGRASAAAEDVFHAEGGFKANNRPIEQSQPLVPDLDDEYADSLLTVATLGAFLTVVGIMLVGADVGSATASVLGAVLVLVGGGVLAYDYAIRTREWAELACVEEGTVYPVAHNEFSADGSDGPFPVPETTTTETAAMLSVTVSAKCTPLFDEEELESDFESLVAAVEAAAEDCQFDVEGDAEELAYEESTPVDAEAN
ncbi:hypothetical protein GS429_02690 [Natronorubrum sp. JWXQ-INN-674]|uniref:Uncharacterized protein n=1 Tax=Natronorubrum halalkaliphilum TaxID=2691917 RepID=A0A6B0VJK1_9EURY|nr:hypothetical protein [Natronorubrum halalkaliphilum]MXV60982.1 hypothetical protein [Natronorubrum halalkaliphilum]